MLRIILKVYKIFSQKKGRRELRHSPHTGTLTSFILFSDDNICLPYLLDQAKDHHRVGFKDFFIYYSRAAICCLGGMYEKLGRMMGRSYEETVTTLVRSLKSAESQTRLEIMNTLEKVNIIQWPRVPQFLGKDE